MKSIANLGGQPKAMTVCSAGLIVLLAFALFFFKNFHSIQVSGPSMQPTFQSGERLLASSAYWLIGPVKDGDIVVVEDEGTRDHIIKRVYKTAGETVDYLNMPRDRSLAEGKYVVPEGKVYLLGDNREVSEDSRSFGPVDTSKILGKIVLKKWL